MAASLRVQNTAADSDPDLAAGLTGVQAGDLLVALIYERDGGAVSGVSDDVNGAWTQAVNRAAVAARCAIFYFANSGAGNPTVTATIAGSAPKDMNVSAWSGVGTGAADTTNNAGNSATFDHAHGSVTPSGSSLLVTCLCLGNDYGTMTATGFTALNTDAGVTNANRRYYAYKVTHTGALNPTFTSGNSQSSDAGVAAFLESGGGGGTAVPVFVNNLRVQGIL